VVEGFRPGGKAEVDNPEKN